MPSGRGVWRCGGPDWLQRSGASWSTAIRPTAPCTPRTSRASAPARRAGTRRRRGRPWRSLCAGGCDCAACRQTVNTSPTLRPTISDNLSPVPSARQKTRWSLGCEAETSSRDCCSERVSVGGDQVGHGSPPRTLGSGSGGTSRETRRRGAQGSAGGQPPTQAQAPIWLRMQPCRVLFWPLPSHSPGCHTSAESGGTNESGRNPRHRRDCACPSESCSSRCRAPGTRQF